MYQKLLEKQMLPWQIYGSSYTQKKKFSQYRHCVQWFCETVLILWDSLNIDKNLTQHEIHIISYNVEHFQQTF